jgi:hypothetical protein
MGKAVRVVRSIVAPKKKPQPVVVAPAPVATVSKPQAAGIRPKAPILSAFADASATTRNFQERQERFGLG